MSDKVNYNKVKVDFSKIIVTLHKKAMEIASQKYTGKKLINTAFDENGENFNGAGEYMIFSSPDPIGENVSDENKGEYLEFSKEYVKYFVGEDASKLITEKDIQPISDLRPDEASSGTPETTSSEKSADVEPEGETTSESNIFSREEKSIEDALNMIFEEDSETSREGGTEPDSEAGSEDDGSKDSSPTRKQLGFYLAYAVDVERQNRKKSGPISGLINSLKSAGGRFLGGILSDLKNIEIKTMGGQSYRIGKVFDPIGFKIDKDTIGGSFNTTLSNEFPRSSIKGEIWDTQTLIDALNKQKKLSPEIKTKLKGVKYVLCVAVPHNDYSYRQISKQKIADIFNKASGLDEKIIRKHVNEDTIILVNNFSKNVDKYETLKKILNKITSDEQKSSKKEQSGGTESDKDPKTVSEGLLIGFDDIVIESILSELFESDILEERNTKGIGSLSKKHLVNILKYVPDIDPIIKNSLESLSKNALFDKLNEVISKYPTLKTDVSGMKTSDVINKLTKELSKKSESDPKKEPEKEPEGDSVPVEEDSVDLYIIPSKYISKVDKNDKK